MAAPVGFDGRAGRQLCPYEAQYINNKWGGGEVEFLTEKKNSAKKCSWGLKTPKKNVGGGGEFFFPTKIFFF